MGFIADKLKTKKTPTLHMPNNMQGPLAWRRVFGTNKEREFPVVNEAKPTIPGGTYSRGVLGTQSASIKRLITALRSSAPGGWASDKWAESNHWQSIVYAAGHPICKQMSMAEFQVFHKDSNHPDGKRPVNEDDPPEGDRICRPWDLVKLLEKPNNQLLL